MPSHKFLIIAGDFNAQVGGDCHLNCPRIVGQHTFHTSTNDNGERLVGYASEHYLRFVQQRFAHRAGRMWSWSHPGGNHHSQIDHILVSARWINSDRNCRAYNTVNLESNHRIICANFRLSLRVTARQPNRIKLIDWNNLSIPAIKDRFQLELTKRFNPISEKYALPSCNLQKHYDALLEVIEKKAFDVIGIKQRKKHPQWVSEHSLNLINARDQAIRVYLNTHSKHRNKLDRKLAWLELIRHTTSSLQNDEIQSLEIELRELQLANDRHDSR